MREGVKPKSTDHHRRWVLRLFEWGVITGMIALLYGVFLNHVERAQAEIERQNFLTAVRGMQTAVLLQSVIRPKTVAPGGNPAKVYYQQFSILPAGYVGEFNRPDPVTVTGGSWYFDSGEHQLVYRVRHTRYFQQDRQGSPLIRMQLVVKPDSDQLTLKILDAGDWIKGADNFVKQ